MFKANVDATILAGLRLLQALGLPIHAPRLSNLDDKEVAEAYDLTYHALQRSGLTEAELDRLAERFESNQFVMIQAPQGGEVDWILNAPHCDIRANGLLIHIQANYATGTTAVEFEAQEGLELARCYSVSTMARGPFAPVAGAPRTIKQIAYRCSVKPVEV